MSMLTGNHQGAPCDCLFSPAATDSLLRLLERPRGVSAACATPSPCLQEPPWVQAVCGLCHACPWYFRGSAVQEDRGLGRPTQGSGPASGPAASLVIGRAVYSINEYTARRSSLESLRRQLGDEGRCGLHEIAFIDRAVPEPVRREVAHAVTGTLGHGAGLLSVEEWLESTAQSGLLVEHWMAVPLCKPRSVRLLPRGCSPFGGALCGPRLTLLAAKRRVRRMRAALGRHHERLATLLLVLRAA